ncbi:hypothetical protein J7W19_30960 [Streptomyces mobaraensis NBRC 13819 = DSM 40847]|uniref:Histidine phosphatase family protein n=2 Tax=Streptomyces mobaraensis TaxID=35621 RepID=A0A5N5W9C9_STRMB|nr:hypothetical protein [Streptomyces mobaraensis]EMF01299.1 hypothetical protein H340_06841 [Streptomyces mobaraensis NBRC 13819 = DSM 40847]KAB7845018.1 hypothetical protein FRZ00_15005 [Streptomyces mobaraensis]QTT77220.1 hypothetical protein J7W19_30960 [Streptomyces mobaraensis NBRC 13819 = DSM 40847]
MPERGGWGAGLRRLVAAAVCGATVAACGGGGDAAPAPEPTTRAAAGADTVMIIRHAEKPDEDDGGKPPFGVTEDGARNAHALVVRGWQRAGALVPLFAPEGGAPVRPGLRRPDAVYAADAHGAGKGLRPAETVAPLAARLGKPVDSSYGQGQEAALARELAARHGATLVSWEHRRIARIVEGLGRVRPAPPRAWPGDRYDLVWVFTREGTGWRFTQVPQLLLAGDRRDPA